jgi:membrane protease YdiL (CAAX protease family)
VGISEEGLFRGYVQTHLEKFHMSGAILAQAALFGIWHFVWNLSPLDPLGMVRYVGFTFFIGLLFGYFYSKSRNLVPLILAHGLWNSVPSGIVTSVAALEASIQTLIWILPYLVSAALTFLFIKRFVREI